jgi:hypothetical protein
LKRSVVWQCWPLLKRINKLSHSFKIYSYGNPISIQGENLRITINIVARVAQFSRSKIMTFQNQNPEQFARDQIDALLKDAGWVIQPKTKIDLGAGLGVAIREYQTDVGPAD